MLIRLSMSNVEFRGAKACPRPRVARPTAAHQFSLRSCCCCRVLQTCASASAPIEAARSPDPGQSQGMGDMPTSRAIPVQLRPMQRALQRWERCRSGGGKKWRIDNSRLAKIKVTIPRMDTSGVRFSHQPIPTKLRPITNRVDPNWPALVAIPKALMTAKRNSVELLGAATRLGTMAITTWDAANH